MALFRLSKTLFDLLPHTSFIVYGEPASDKLAKSTGTPPSRTLSLNPDTRKNKKRPYFFSFWVKPPVSDILPS